MAMAQLVILLPSRARAAASAGAPAAGPTELSWALSQDGLRIAQHGQALATRLPAADTVVLVVPPTDVAWHRITCPKAPAGKLRAALGGLLEERLLDDDEHTLLALGPGHSAGHPCWVAAIHKPWLKAQLAALAAAGRTVDRVVPSIWPGDAAVAHFFVPESLQTESSASTAQGAAGSGVWLALADPEQALCLPLAGSHAQALLARWRQVGGAFHASPAAAAPAERATGGPVPLRSDLEQGLAAARNAWQLLQFDLAPSRRGTRRLGQLLQHLRTPAWRPVRWGLAALSVVQVLGLSAYAWQLQQRLDQRRADMTALLRSTHPQVRAVLDAPVQMQRETNLLREAAGVAGDADFENLLAALAMAWPDGQGPAAQLKFEPGRLSLPANTWSPPQIDQLRSRLQAGGWQLDQAEGRLTVQRAGGASGATRS